MKQSTLILIIILAVVVLGGGGVAVYFLTKKKKAGAKTPTLPTDGMPTTNSIKLPLSDTNLINLAYDNLDEKQLKSLQDWLLGIIKSRKKAKAEGSTKWQEADTEEGLFLSAIYQMRQGSVINTAKEKELQNAIAMLLY